MTSHSVIFWDFDGVLMNSNEVRDTGFEHVLANYPAEQVEMLMDFHRRNGGLSRYVKFRYFFEEVLGKKVTDNEIQVLAEEFSVIMKKLLTNKTLLIAETIDFVKANHEKYKMHIVSGSDGNELRYLCGTLGIDHYFLSIHGSPTPKKKLVADLLAGHGYDKSSCILIGDSINDWEAADVNGIDFYPYNNNELLSKSTITTFKL